MKPLCIDLFCGLGGWSQGFLAEGYECIGFDVERHDYGTGGYPGQLVLQDVLTLHGSQFREAACIVASPPCQAYSYMAMPWKLGKAKAAAIRADETGRKLADLNALFNACFRIQQEACDSAGRHIPLVVENVKGAQPWVGSAKWHYGSFYLWGDVPALMPMVSSLRSVSKNQYTQGGSWFNVAHGARIPGNQSGAPQRGDGLKVAGFNFHQFEKSGKPGGSFQSAAVADTFGWSKETPLRDCNSKSPRRKSASAQIAKIPLALSQWIARC